MVSIPTKLFYVSTCVLALNCHRPYVTTSSRDCVLQMTSQLYGIARGALVPSWLGRRISFCYCLCFRPRATHSHTRSTVSPVLTCQQAYTLRLPPPVCYPDRVDFHPICPPSQDLAPSTDDLSPAVLRNKASVKRRILKVCSRRIRSCPRRRMPDVADVRQCLP